MTRRVESKIKSGFAGVAVILVLAVTLAVANSHQLQRAREASARSEETLRELEGILATMIDAETGMRGYIITGEDAYLEPYERAISTIDARMSHLKNLLGGPETDGRFDQLQKAVADQIAFRKSTVEKMKAVSGSDAMRRTIRIDEGKRGMDEIRATITQMKAEQERRLVARNE